MNYRSRYLASHVPAICVLLFALFFTSCGGSSSSSTGGNGNPQSPTATEFTLVVLPDTQCYTSEGAPQQPTDCNQSGTMAMFDAQVTWILNNRTAENIAAVASVGDIVQCGSDTDEWTRASAAYQRLDAAGIPYVSVIGNHDYDPGCGSGTLTPRASAGFNQFFGVNRFSGKTWYGGSNFPASANDNSYIVFEGGGQQFMVLGLEFFPRDAAIAWAESVIAAHPNHRVIISTHAYLTGDGNRAIDTDSLGPNRYDLSADNNGQEMWDKLFNRHSNLIAVVDGHFRGASRREDPGVNGNRVAQMHANYQFEGGQGYLRILRINPSTRTISVRTYSPHLNTFKDDDRNRFTISYGAP